MGVQGQPLDKSLIISTIHAKRGIISHVSEALDCTDKCINDWRRRDEDVENAVKEARANNVQMRKDWNEELLNLAYESTKDNLKKRDVTMSIFIMKTLGELVEKQSLNTNIKYEIVDYSKD